MIQQKSFGGVGYPLGIMMSFTAEWKLVHISLCSALYFSRFENLNKTLEFTGLLSTAQHACAYINIHKQAGPTGCDAPPISRHGMHFVQYNKSRLLSDPFLLEIMNYSLRRKENLGTHTQSL
jgi:hypothetical protein